MNKIIIILILSNLFVGLTFGQPLQKIININWISLTETSSESNQQIQFAEQSGYNEYGLPVISIQIPLEQFSGSIEEIDVKVLPKDLLALNAVETNWLNSIQSDQLNMLTKQIVTISKKHFLEVHIAPLSYNKEHNSFLKISRFELNIDIPTISSTVSKPLIKSTAAANSVLSSGKWIKIRISDSGVHRIPYSLLTSWGFSNGASVNVFGNGGNMLPKANSIPRFDDLKENAVWHHNNAIYFYAQGPTKWEYDEKLDMFVHKIHDYVDEAYYFLSDNNGSGLRVELSNESHDSFTHETDRYDSYKYYELEARNLLHSGRTWYGTDIYPGQRQGYNFEFKNLITSEPIQILTEVIGHSNLSSAMETYTNSSLTPIQSINIPKVRYGDYTGNIAHEGIGQTSFYSNTKDVSIDIQYNTSASGAFANLNFLCLNAKENIVASQNLMFRDKSISGAGNITRFYISGSNSNSILWDITDHTAPEIINIETYGSNKGFTLSTDHLKEFVTFNTDESLPEPTKVEDIVNQDLHGSTVPEMLIISHPLFLDQANRLAQLHIQKTGLQCLIVEPQQIYNEFSSGQADVSAIRDFARYLYNKDDRFKYLLLFGDGSYDNRNNDADNSNFILTYQSENSINISASYTTDDFFGFLDDNEGENIQANRLDIGIGRLTVGTDQEAKDVVDKIEMYMFNSYQGPWKAEITFVGDDGDNNLHMRHADLLAQKVQKNHPEFDLNKIYFDAYKKTITSSGDRYPDVNAKVNESFANGTLVFNYTGHGSEKQLAHENILSIGDIQKLSNKDRLPIYITATCEFSRYDNKNLQDGSAGEIVLKTPNGGGIALLTTTRIAWSNSNFDINNNVYNHIFEQDDDGNKLRFGDVVKNTKNGALNSINKLNFHLLGDPALQLAYPTNEINISKINGEADPLKQDTLKALTQINIEGIIGGNSETNLFDNGSVNIKVFDKEVNVQTLGNSGAVPFEYNVYQNRIFNGEIDVQDDVFNASFIVPKDIRYNVGSGRISFYGSDINNVEAFGANNDIKVGSVSDNPPDDSTGPEIVLWLNDVSFKNGGTTGSRPILYAELRDESGINTSGVGIGHDLSLTINDDRSKAIILNDYYSSEKNNFKKGSLSFQLPTMEPGKHTLQLKAWDNLNNSSISTLDFYVENNGNLEVGKAIASPNPAAPGETIKISFQHDAPNSTLKTTTTLYTISGRLIDQVENSVPSFGNTILPYDYKLPSNLQKGLYILNCEMEAEEGQIGRFSKKILVIK